VDAARRVTVTHPATRAARAGSAPDNTARREVEEQTAVGELLVRALVRTQLRLALRVGAVMVCLFGGLPLLFAISPAVRSARLLGVPVPWLLLGLVIYPLLVALGALHVRLAERAERDYARMVDR
jgi:hypothetical protein